MADFLYLQGKLEPPDQNGTFFTPKKLSICTGEESTNAHTVKSDCTDCGQTDFLKGGAGVKVRFKLLPYLRILLFIAGEPQKVDRQKYI